MPQVIKKDVEQAAEILADQGRAIVQEWRQDTADGTHKPHDLAFYFAGKIDQHNTLIAVTARAFPELQHALPQALDFSRIQAQIEQEQTKQQEPTQNGIVYGI